MTWTDMTRRSSVAVWLARRPPPMSRWGVRYARYGSAAASRRSSSPLRAASSARLSTSSRSPPATRATGRSGASRRCWTSAWSTSSWSQMRLRTRRAHAVRAQPEAASNSSTRRTNAEGGVPMPAASSISSVRFGSSSPRSRRESHPTETPHAAPASLRESPAAARCSRTARPSARRWASKDAIRNERGGSPECDALHE